MNLTMIKHAFCLFFLISCSILTTADQSLDGNKNTTCGELGDCPSIETDCNDICGCDKTIPTTFNNETQECVVNVTLLMLSLPEKYNTPDYDMSMENDMATKIRAEADRIFQGVIFAAVFFVSCASSCVILACIYCCRMNYTDYTLKKSIKELAKKVGANPQLRKGTVKSPTKPISESCNVVVEEAGVFCV